MSDTMEESVDSSSPDQEATSYQEAGPASDAGSASSSLTDDHHDWTSAFTGIDTRAGSAGGSAANSAGSNDAPGGGLFSGIADAVGDAASGVISTAENVASDVGQTVSDAASGVVETAKTVAGDVGQTVSNAASGIADTAGKVAGDIGSGNFGEALGDAESGVVSTAGHVVSDVAHTAVDGASGMLSTAGKIITDTNQTITDAATGVISTAGKVVGDTAQAVAQAAGPDSMLGQAAGAVGNFSTAAASGLVDTVNTVNDFNKGVVEGVVGGVEGLGKGLVSLGDSVGKEAFALATDEKAREQAGQTLLHGAEAVGNFEMTLMTDPTKALGQVGDAASGAVDTAENMASHVYKDYQAAAAQGHGAEFIGKGVGQAAVVVAGAVLTDGASVAGEGAALAGEGAALLGEGAAVAGEGAALLGEGAAVVGEGAAVVGEGATVATEAAAATTEATATATAQGVTATAETAAADTAATTAETTAASTETAAAGDAAEGGSNYIDIGEDPELQATAQEVDNAGIDLEPPDEEPIPRRDVSREQARREANSGAARVRSEQGMTDPDVQAGHTQAARHTPESGAPREQVNDPDTFQHLHSRRGQGLDVDVTDQEGITKTTTRHRAQEGVIDDAVERSRAGGQLTPEGQQAAGDEVRWRTDGTGFDQREVQMKRDSGLFDENAAIERMKANKASQAVEAAQNDAAATGPSMSEAGTQTADAAAGPQSVSEISEPSIRVRVSTEDMPASAAGEAEPPGPAISPPRVRVAMQPSPASAADEAVRDALGEQELAEEAEAEAMAQKAAQRGRMRLDPNGQRP